MSWTRVDLPSTFGEDVNIGHVFSRCFTAPPHKREDGKPTPEFKKAKARHVEMVSNLRTASYKAFFDRWYSTLSELKGSTGSGTTEFVTLQSKSRLVVGLGAESIIETSIAMHRTYGVPVVPGSALKGVARRFARQALGEEWGEGTNAFRMLFGTVGDDVAFRGLVTFHDALPWPGKWSLLPDTITTHHPDYYTGRKEEVPAPSDGDEPNPVPFLAVTGDFLLPLTGPLAWVQAAARILRLALRESGVGAKTYIGYGRMDLIADWLPEEPSREAAPNSKGASNASPAARPTKEVCVERFTVSKGNPQRYATATIEVDGTKMNIVAPKSIEGVETIADRKGKGPAVCTVEFKGGNAWHVVSLRLLES